MKIVFFISSVDAGGVASVVRNLATEYKNSSDFNVTILTTTPFHESVIKKKLGKEGILLQSLNVKNFNFLSLLMIYLRTILFMAQHRDIDIIFCPGLAYYMIIFPVKKVLFLKAKTIFNPHTNLKTYLQSQNRVKKIYYSMAKRWLPKADKIVAETHDAKSTIEDLYNITNVHVIPNPIVTDDDLAFEQKTDLAPHEWLKDKKLITFVACGRIIKTKNIQFMIDVFAKINLRKNNTRLLIIGEGEQKEHLENHIVNIEQTDTVELLGHQIDPKKYFYHADYVWMTSTLEGMPVVLCEALSMGTPCIANRYGDGINDVLKDSDKIYGLIIDHYDVDDNVELILNELNKQKQDRTFYRQKAMQFKSDIIANKYLQGL